MLTFANVVWGARCGESARRVLLGETRSRGYAYSVRRRRESALTRQAPHGLPSSRLVSTILLDEWFAEQVQPRLRSTSSVVRYCDDFVMLFACKEDAERVQAVLGKRLAKFGLELHPDKTRLVDFRPSAERAGVESTLPTTFAFLGFLHIWSKTRTGKATVWQRTAKDRLARTLKAINDQCRFMRPPWSIGRGGSGGNGCHGDRGRATLPGRSSCGWLNAIRCLPLGSSIATPDRGRSCAVKNRMRELRSCGSVRAEGSNVLGYSEVIRQSGGDKFR